SYICRTTVDVGNCHFSFNFILFFFSSRRRHTRWPRDWSSDVCSSDLQMIAKGLHFPVVGALRQLEQRVFPLLRVVETLERGCGRSEERRVGKECGCRWSGCH